MCSVDKEFAKVGVVVGVDEMFDGAMAWVPWW